MYTVVWGFAHTGKAVGFLGQFNTKEEAQAEINRFYTIHWENPTCGAWIE